MQYILTEEEYAELKKVKRIRENKDKEVLLKTCQLAADHIPIIYPNSKELAPWGCIRTETNIYCDNCPVEYLCPYEFKIWSK